MSTNKETKKLIISNTIELTNKKPFNRITINDIVKLCGITRNTFYYYFHDIYEVIDVFVEDELINFDFSKEEESIFDFLQNLSKYSKTWVNIYRHSNRDLFEGIVKKKIRELLVAYIKFRQIEINDEDRDLICTFYEEALYGLLCRYIHNHIRGIDNNNHMYNRIRTIFNGQIELIIDNINKNNKSIS